MISDCRSHILLQFGWDQPVVHHTVQYQIQSFCSSPRKSSSHLPNQVLINGTQRNSLPTITLYSLQTNHQTSTPLLCNPFFGSFFFPQSLPLLFSAGIPKALKIASNCIKSTQFLRRNVALFGSYFGINFALFIYYTFFWQK